jgi:hypothetical protein
MANETLYAFNESDSQALLQSIGAKASGGQNGNDHVSTADILVAVATSIITAKAGSAVGTGTAKAKQIQSNGTLANLICFRVGNRWLAVEIC